MSNTYERIRQIIRAQRYTSDSNTNVDHVDFMLEESVSDNELSIEEYIQLQSELSDTMKRRSR